MTTPPKCCERNGMTDLTNGLGPDRNYYCGFCGSHYYKGKLWSRKEWDDWINEGELEWTRTKRLNKRRRSAG